MDFKNSAGGCPRMGVRLHGYFHGFGDFSSWARRRAHAGARNFRQTTDCTASMAHVLWMVHRYRFVLPGAATSVSRVAARIAAAAGAGLAAPGTVDFLDDSSSI